MPDNLPYWVTTGLVALGLIGGGLGDVTGGMDPQMAALGYPVYFARILGSWKLAGAVALLAPGYGRVKEWAYAGLVFTFSGAALSHLASGDGIAEVAPPLVFLALAIASYKLRPADRRI